MSHTTQQATANGRDDKGRFTNGNIGGPGNPYARQMAQLRRELLVSVTAEDVQDIAKRFVDMAKGGSVPAAKFLFSYIIGKPTAPAVEPDRVAVHEWDVFTETATMQNNFEKIMHAPHPELALETMRFTRPRFALFGSDALVEQFKDLDRQEKKQAKRKKRRKRSRNGKRAPITNGVSSGGAPMTNGVSSPGAPSKNGESPAGAPSTNGVSKLQELMSQISLMQGGGLPLAGFGGAD